MKRLPTEFRKNGYQYSQIWRDEDYAVYLQASMCAAIAYEVFKIKKNPATDATSVTLTGKDGKILTVNYEAKEAHESVPPTEAWGKQAFTCASREDCYIKIDRMREEVKINSTRDWTPKVGRSPTE